MHCTYHRNRETLLSGLSIQVILKISKFSFLHVLSTIIKLYFSFIFSLLKPPGFGIAVFWQYRFPLPIDLLPFAVLLTALELLLVVLLVELYKQTSMLALWLELDTSIVNWTDQYPLHTEPVTLVTHQDHSVLQSFLEYYFITFLNHKIIIQSILINASAHIFFSWLLL